MNGEPNANQTCFVWLFNFIDRLVNIQLQPFDLYWVRVKEVSHMATVEANVLFTTNFEFLPQIDKDRSNIVSALIRAMELGILRLGAEVESIVRALCEDSFA